MKTETRRRGGFLLQALEEATGGAKEVAASEQEQKRAKGSADLKKYFTQMGGAKENKIFDTVYLQFAHTHIHSARVDDSLLSNFIQRDVLTHTALWEVL